MKKNKKELNKVDSDYHGEFYYSNNTSFPQFETGNTSYQPDTFDYVESVSDFDDFEKTYEFVRGELVAHFRELHTYDVRAATTLQKFEEIQHYYSSTNNSNLENLKKKLWTFNDINDKSVSIQQIESLEPILVLGDENWVHYRRLIHTGPYSSGIGISMRYYIIDKTSQKLLGLIELSSDFGSLSSRDEQIGWTKNNRYQDGKLNHTAILSTCVATQPFGFNLIGGKLMALLACSNLIRDHWKQLTGYELLGITTTSLYGNNSGTMYNGIERFWKSLKSTKGDVIPNLSNELYDLIKGLFRKFFPEEMEKIKSQTTPKQKLLNLILKKYNIKREDCTHGYERGVYFSTFYEETKSILCGGNIPPVLTPRFDSSVSGLFQYWKTKSLNRYTKLHKEGKLNPTPLFYDNLI